MDAKILQQSEASGRFAVWNPISYSSGCAGVMMSYDMAASRQAYVLL
jgi:hypothetical protein